MTDQTSPAETAVALVTAVSPAVAAMLEHGDDIAATMQDPRIDQAANDALALIGGCDRARLLQTIMVLAGVGAALAHRVDPNDPLSVIRAAGIAAAQTAQRAQDDD